MTSKAIYTAKVHTTGGRDGGSSRSDDGRLDVRLSSPGKGSGTNPEQLFAAGWSACFEGTMTILAKKMQIEMPPNCAIDAEVTLNQGDNGYFLSGELKVSLPGLDAELARALIRAAHETCPYSKATRGNVDVKTSLV